MGFIMLLSFTVKNFLSFSDEVELNMIAADNNSKLPENISVVYINTKKPKEVNVLKSAAIYGANASGKTNMLIAFKNFIDIILSFDSFDSNEKPEKFPVKLAKLPVMPFLLHEIKSKEPTEFEILVLLNNVEYRYGFTATGSNIHQEWLYSTETTRERLVFTREFIVGSEKANYKFGSRESSLKVLTEEHNFVDTKTLLLFVANMFNNAIAKELFGFFERFKRIDPSNLGINGPEIEEEHLPALIHLIKLADIGIKDIKLLDFLTPDLQKQLNQLNHEMASGNTSIASDSVNKDDGQKDTSNDVVQAIKITRITSSDIHAANENSTDEMEELSFSFDELITKLKKKKTLHFFYKNNTGKEVSLPAHVQSKGTLVLLELFSKILKYYKTSSVLFCDELEHGLHPMLCEEFLKVFHSLPGNKAQLIFTTHNTKLLQGDLFRRDQIWITEKERSGNSKLYSLAEFKGLRSEMPLEKYYLEGRFGGLPFFDLKEKNKLINLLTLENSQSVNDTKEHD